VDELSNVGRSNGVEALLNQGHTPTGLDGCDEARGTRRALPQLAAAVFSGANKSESQPWYSG